MPSSSDYLILAERDRKIAMLAENEFPDEYAVAGAAYHMQQAVEKLLKGLILIYGETPEFTHDISRLCSHAQKLGITLSEDIIDVADSLTLWESRTRYDPSAIIIRRKYITAKSVYTELHEKLKGELDMITIVEQTDINADVDINEDEQSRGR